MVNMKGKGPRSGIDHNSNSVQQLHYLFRSLPSVSQIVHPGIYLCKSCLISFDVGAYPVVQLSDADEQCHIRAIALLGRLQYSVDDDDVRFVALVSCLGLMATLVCDGSDPKHPMVSGMVKAAALRASLAVITACVDAPVFKTMRLSRAYDDSQIEIEFWDHWRDLKVRPRPAVLVSGTIILNLSVIALVGGPKGSAGNMTTTTFGKCSEETLCPKPMLFPLVPHYISCGYGLIR